MAAVVIGWRYGDLGRDTDGHRTYKLVYQVQVAQTEGPATAIQAIDAVIPVGTAWTPPGSTDADVYAYRRQETNVKAAEGTDTAVRQWLVETVWSTRSDSKFCKDGQFENPLLEPQKVSGSFTKYTEEAVYDRFGRYIVNSAHEQIRGPTVEFDASRPTVKIEQNVTDLQLPLLAALQDCVNDVSMWGLPARCVKLSNADWDVKYYGTCFKYYTRKLEFDVRYDGFDRDILDEGTKVLHGRWHPTLDVWQLIDIAGAAPNPDNPLHFSRYKDRNSENTRVILNGRGLPISTDPSGTATSTQLAGPRYPGNIHVEKYLGANLMLLGIPSSI